MDTLIGFTMMALVQIGENLAACAQSEIFWAFVLLMVIAGAGARREK